MEYINEFVPLSKDIIGKNNEIFIKSEEEEVCCKKDKRQDSFENLDEVSKVAITAITSMNHMVKMVADLIINKIND